jgi:hypothetical protein
LREQGRWSECVRERVMSRETKREIIEERERERETGSRKLREEKRERARKGVSGVVKLSPAHTSAMLTH